MTWVDTSNNEDGFRIERRTGTDETFVFIANQNANLTSYTDTDLALGTRYCYRVRAFNAFGDSPYSAESCATTPTLLVTLESPEDGQPVSGIGVIRGWAFDTKIERQVQSIELSVDGVPRGKIPCCSPRGDVQTAFPQFPLQNAGNSGWGMPVNYGSLSTGSHSLGVRIEDSLGGTRTFEQGVEIIQVGGFPFLDQVSLAGVTTRIEGDEIVLSGVQVRDKASQQTRIVTISLRWFQGSQSLVIVSSA